LTAAVSGERETPETEGVRLVSVVSRKTHGRAGTFDINLPQTPKPGIECRSGDYAIVFTFASNVSIQSARVTSGAGRVKNYSVTGNQVLVNLTRVDNAQTVVVTLSGVNDGINTSDVQATIGVLIGDVTADGVVNSIDVHEVQSQLGHPVTASNFRDDVKVDGVINRHDVNMVESRSVTGL